MCAKWGSFQSLIEINCRNIYTFSESNRNTLHSTFVQVPRWTTTLSTLGCLQTHERQSTFLALETSALLQLLLSLLAMSFRWHTCTDITYLHIWRFTFTMISIMKYRKCSSSFRYNNIKVKCYTSAFLKDVILFLQDIYLEDKFDPIHKMINIFPCRFH